MTDPRTDLADSRFWAVVPAGGAGTRLWPLSRSARPKFLLDLTGSGRTLLQQTVDRVQPLVGERVLVVTGEKHAAAVEEQLAGIDPRVLAEPSPRDSMAAIGWAAAVLEREDPDAILGSFAADHVIGDLPGFHQCVREAVAAAAAGHLVTIGIEPTHAATGFGYVELGEPLAGFASARAVASFVEKPDAATAARYLEGGRHRWNGGMFVVRAATLLDLLGEHHPELATGLRELAAEPSRLGEIWPALTKIAIDHAVAEPAAADGRVVCVPGNFAWDDLGDFASLAAIGADDLIIHGDSDLVTAVDSTGLVVTADRPIAVLGLSDAVVVDTGDALLVTTMAHAQRVKEIVTRLKEGDRADLT